MLGPPKPRRLDEPIAVSLEDPVPPGRRSGPGLHVAPVVELTWAGEELAELVAD